MLHENRILGRPVGTSDTTVVLFGMPRKIRELIRDLERAGFVNRGGKGGHQNFLHSKGTRVTISGNSGADAKPYQEKAVRAALGEIQT